MRTLIHPGPTYGVHVIGFVTGLVLLPPIARACASTADPGALSLFNYTSKLVELPLGVLMGALSTVLLPHLAANPSTAAAVAISLPALLWAAPGRCCSPPP